MIWGNIENLQEYSYLEEQIKKCFVYAAEHDLLNCEKGRYDIEGDDLYVNVVEYQTISAEERFWEAHKKYIDLHLVLCGQEQIDLSFVQNMQLKEYEEESDFLPMDGKKSGSVVLTSGDFLICYPSDGHRTAVAVEKPENVRKVIFKINMKLNKGG